MLRSRTAHLFELVSGSLRLLPPRVSASASANAPHRTTRYRTLTSSVSHGRNLPIMRDTPILPCGDFSSISIRSSSSSSSHPLQNPTFYIPESLQSPLEEAAQHLRNGDAVALPTETVYGLGANSLNRAAVKKIYRIKNRPSDNPLIIHVSSLDMLDRLLPPKSIYTPSKLYMALISAFWPGPLTLLFPSPNPPPPPAPQTNAIRMPKHPLALALIHTADLPVSAPSANSSGRPSPTTAQHVYNDLKGAEGLGCILDGGDCGVGVESTVVNGLAWAEGGGGSIDVLRPGGLGVEEIARVVAEVDDEVGKTRILLHGEPWTPSTAIRAPSKPTAKSAPAAKPAVAMAPSTPGMKYRHYSPRVPVYLFMPSNTFDRPDDLPQQAETSAQGLLRSIGARHSAEGKRARIGLLHYEDSPLSKSILTPASSDGAVDIVPLSLGKDATSGAQRLFGGMLRLEGRSSAQDDSAANGSAPETDGVDAIIIEGCSNAGLGLAVMERAGKAVGGGGKSGHLGNGQTSHGDGQQEGRYWVQV